MGPFNFTTGLIVVLFFLQHLHLGLGQNKSFFKPPAIRVVLNLFL